MDAVSIQDGFIPGAEVVDYDLGWDVTTLRMPYSAELVSELRRDRMNFEGGVLSWKTNGKIVIIEVLGDKR